MTIRARLRHPSDRGVKTACGICGGEFTAVWEKPDGSLGFYWCLKCDRSDFKRKK